MFWRERQKMWSKKEKGIKLFKEYEWRKEELREEQNTRLKNISVSILFWWNQVWWREKITGESAKSSHWVSDWILSPDLDMSMTCQDSFLSLPSPSLPLSPSSFYSGRRGSFTATHDSSRDQEWNLIPWIFFFSFLERNHQRRRNDKERKKKGRWKEKKE